ncbi:MAG: phosphoribosyltransferase family protein [Micrococcus sp.]|nr:phosphoribosyltransferase family protein [Micrococcus sp.]
MTPWTHSLAAGLDRALQPPAVRRAGRAARELAGLLLPVDCAVCGLRDGAVCPECAGQLAGALLRPFRAERDAAALPLVSAGPDAGPVPLAVVAAGRYDGSLARALLAFKDHGRTPVGRHLRPAVHRALAAVPALVTERPPGGPGVAPALLVPVPGSAAGFRRRGYDPVAELLTGPLPPGWELAPWLLRPARRRAGPGAGLGRGSSSASHAGTAATLRRRRSTGRFRATDPARFPGSRSVVLFDDVMTTGSTLAAAWHALDRVGRRPVAAVVLAAVTAPGARPSGGLNSP